MFCCLRPFLVLPARGSREWAGGRGRFEDRFVFSESVRAAAARAWSIPYWAKGTRFLVRPLVEMQFRQDLAVPGVQCLSLRTSFLLFRSTTHLLSSPTNDGPQILTLVTHFRRRRQSSLASSPTSPRPHSPHSTLVSAVYLAGVVVFPPFNWEPLLSTTFLWGPGRYSSRRTVTKPHPRSTSSILSLFGAYTSPGPCPSDLDVCAAHGTPPLPLPRLAAPSTCFSQDGCAGVDFVNPGTVSQ